MPETVRPAAMPRTFLTEAPAAAMNVGMSLLNRRSNAVADYWRSFAEVRQPTDLMALQLNYWSQLVDDYQQVLSEGVSQIAAAEPAAPQGPPPQAARSA